MDNSLTSLIETVQHNCHIADARHAGEYTLCVYLLKMREMYRWEQGIGFQKQLTTDDVGDWLTQREGLWDDIEEQDYKHIQINNTKTDTYEPFDNDLINTLLDEHKLVYNAGLGVRCRPHFFIADLEERQEHENYTIYISGKEYARDMAAPAAMAQESRIFIRRESLRRVIWEVLDDTMVTGLDNPLTRAMSFYDFESDIGAALDQMTEVEIKYVIQHEIGEVKAGRLLDSLLENGWNNMLSKYQSTQAEIMLRALRDHLADSITTLPALIEENNPASLHFYFGNLSSMRKHLAPSLVNAYSLWLDNNQSESFENILSDSKQHWETLAKKITQLFDLSLSHEKLEKLIIDNKF